MTWTDEELAELHRLRKQEAEESAQEADLWAAANEGYTEAGTEYAIQYQSGTGPVWYDAHPFYEPIRPDHTVTRSKAEAEEVADLLLKGERAVSRGRDPREDNVTGVRVIERTASATILRQVHRTG